MACRNVYPMHHLGKGGLSLVAVLLSSCSHISCFVIHQFCCPAVLLAAVLLRAVLVSSQHIEVGAALAARLDRGPGYHRDHPGSG